MSDVSEEWAPLECMSLNSRFEGFLRTNGIFTIEELSKNIGAAPDVTRTVVNRFKQSSGIRIDSLRKRDGRRLYYIVPREQEDVTGFFIRKARELRKYDIVLTHTGVADRVNLMISLGVVQENSDLAKTLLALSDGSTKTMAELSKACERVNMNMPVLFRKVIPKLPLFGLELSSQTSNRYEVDRKKGQAQKEYALKRLSLGLDDYFDEFRGRLVFVAHSILKDSHEAEELVDGVQTHMFEKESAATLPADINYAAYVSQAVRNAAFNVLRDKKRREEIVRSNQSQLAIGLSKNPENAVVEGHRAQVLYKLMARLNPDHTEVLRLFYFEGMTTEQIAEHMGVKQGTILSRLSRARDGLRTELTSNGFTSSNDL